MPASIHIKPYNDLDKWLQALQNAWKSRAPLALSSFRSPEQLHYWIQNEFREEYA
jgi:anaerobic selenocysteine-containing dehydrogenase